MIHQDVGEGVREAAKGVLLARVNEAREVLGRSTYRALDEKCWPNDCTECVLGHHLNTSANDVEVLIRDPADAEVLSKLWETGWRQSYAPADDSRWVTLPDDLQVATALFDAGQIPELIDEEVLGEYRPDHYGTRVPEEQAASALGVDG